MGKIDKLINDILQAKNLQVSFTEIKERTYQCQTTQPQTIVFFACRNRLKVSTQKNTVTVTI
jgi:hypothetical protein